MRNRRGRAPARKKQQQSSRIVEVTVEEIGARGDGIAPLEGGSVYLPFTAPGDRVQARIEGLRGEGLAGSVEALIEPGPDRVTPPCSHFGTCGGCSLQQLSSEAYRVWKRGLLVAALARQGLGDAPVAPLVAVPPGNRRRAAFSFQRTSQGVVLGFNARASRTLVDLHECLLLCPDMVALLPALRALFGEVLPDRAKGDVIVTLAENGLDVLVESALRLDLGLRETLVDFANLHDLARLSWRQPGDSFVDPLAARRIPTVTFGQVPVELSPAAFLQPSRQGEEAIAALVCQAVTGAKRVADLFAGCGSFTFPLAETALVHAVEGDDAAFSALRQAADRMGGAITVTSEMRDLARRPLIAQELKRFDAIVFDPPRAGADEQCCMLAEGGPDLVVGISCNPATFARDARILVDGGYRLEQVTPIDQFPWSAHLEAVAIFRR